MQHVHILGLGALGSLWGGYLSRSLSVSYIPKPGGLSQICHFTIQEGNHESKVSLPASNFQQNPCLETVLVFTKAYDTLAALQRIESHLTKDSMVVLFQNGMGSQQAVRDYLKGVPVFVASTTEGANRVNEQTICHAGRGNTWIGPFNEAARQIHKDDSRHPGKLLCLSSLNVIFDMQIQNRLWYKLAINCGINPYTALLNTANGKIISSPLFQHTIKGICNELNEVMSANGLAHSDALEIEHNIREICLSTAENISSTLQDIRLHKKTELDYMTGFIIQEGLRLGIATPYHASLMHKCRFRGL